MFESVDRNPIKEAIIESYIGTCYYIVIIVFMPDVP